MFGFAFALPDAVRRQPFAWADGAASVGAYAAFDFLSNQHRLGGTIYPAIASVPGWSFARASTGYARTQAGVLTSFASGAPRITDKGLLIEGARTNLLLRSQEFDNASWTKSNASITADQATAPDGTTTADLHTASAANGFALQAVTISSGATVTASYYFKRSNVDFVRIRCSAGADNKSAYFNLATGAVSTVDAAGAVITAISSAVEALANGWYRCIVVCVTTGVTTFTVTAVPAQTGGGNSVNTDAVLVWGAQLEAAAGASSYIPTAGSTVTRAADVAQITGFSIASPVSLFTEAQMAAFVAASQYLMTLDNAGSDIYQILINSTPELAVNTLVSSVAQGPGAGGFSGGVSALTTFKAAYRSALNDMRGVKNASLGTADTSGSAPATATVLRLGVFNASNNQLFGYLRRAAIYPAALSNAQLQALTT